MVATVKVYPRVGGGTITVGVLLGFVGGLSPRGRGNPCSYRRNQRLKGSIPAWAGEPATFAATAMANRVYPRVGGGTSTGGQTWKCCAGLSPRGRGNRCGQGQEPFTGRSIPAWAGEPLSDIGVDASQQVYPRVGGGTRDYKRTWNTRNGLSPRGRGNLCPKRCHLPELESIPAWAGEPICLSGEVWATWVYPRVGGGTLLPDVHAVGVDGLSPRGRGNHPYP